MWRARTSTDEQGWMAELWIPFSQLRFTNRGAQIWGLNVQRWGHITVPYLDLWAFSPGSQRITQ